MKASILALVGAAAAVSAQNGTIPYTTSTVYATSVYTITSCAPTVTNCPARIGQVTTEIISLYTTYCPVAASATAAHSTPAPYSSAAAGGYSTSTVYSTATVTISKCHPDVTNCPFTTAPVTSVKTYAVSTTVVPVTSVPVVTYPASSVPAVTYPASAPVSTAKTSAPASYPVVSASKPAGVVSVITISTCIPTVYTEVITVTPTSSGYAQSSSGGIVPPKSTYSSVPFNGASAQKAGGLLMALGFVAALL